MKTTRILRVKTIEPPTGHLLSIETCRAQCEVVPIDGDSDSETHPDDALILGMLDAAVEAAEDFTGLSIQLRTLEIALDEFPDGAIEIPRPPLVELISVSAGNDSDGELDPATYTLDDYGDMARLKPVTTWPTVIAAPNTVKIRFRAGYSAEGAADTDAPPLPSAIRAAILLMTAHLYANREEGADKAVTSIPFGFHALLRPKRVRLGFA